MKVELIYFDGCPNYMKAKDILIESLAKAKIKTLVEIKHVSNDEDCKKEKFIGSPTIRINGKDVEVRMRTITDYSMRCRIYRTPNGFSGWPPKQMITSAIKEAIEEGNKQ